MALAKDQVDAEITADEEPKKMIVEHLLSQVQGFQAHEVCMKNASIDSRINTIKTQELIEDIKNFSGSFMRTIEEVDEKDICERLTKELPESIDVNRLFNEYESNEKESDQLLLFLRSESLEYNKLLKLVRNDISRVVACKLGDIN